MTMRRLALAMLAAFAAVAFALPTPTLAQEIRLRMGHDQPLGSMYDEGHQMFKKLVEERSQGKIRVDVFPAAQLGSEVAMVEGVRLGSIDVICANSPNAATVIPELGLFSVAYLFKDLPHFERVANDPKFVKRMDELIASKNLGIKLIGFYSAGVRNIYSRKGSVASPDDLKGVKIRVQNNPVEVKVWRTFGAIPTPMNFGEVYQALQSGVLDAAENGLAVVDSNKHYEAAKFISQTEHQRSLSLLLINEKKLASLPPDLQKVVLTAAAEAAVHERKKDAEFVAAAADRLKSKGAVLTSPDKAKFVALIAPIQDELAKELKSADLLEMVRANGK
jgi:tripartite ATP-independent transporter DctP family solute receptor